MVLHHLNGSCLLNVCLLSLLLWAKRFSFLLVYSLTMRKVWVTNCERHIHCKRFEEYWIQVWTTIWYTNNWSCERILRIDCVLFVIAAYIVPYKGTHGLRLGVVCKNWRLLRWCYITGYARIRFIEPHAYNNLFLNHIIYFSSTFHNLFQRLDLLCQAIYDNSCKKVREIRPPSVDVSSIFWQHMLLEHSLIPRT